MSRSGLDGSAGALFEVGLRNGVWEVLRDGAFFGRYRGRAAAVAAAKDAARLPLSLAADAKVVIRENDS